MKFSVSVGAYSMALAIMLGAFGAHSLKPLVSEYSVEIFNKGVYYQIIHSIGIMLGAFLLKNERSLRILTYLFVCGIVAFSGSLYALTFADFLPTIVKKIVGPVTPLGGVFFVASWLFLARSFRKEFNN